MALKEETKIVDTLLHYAIFTGADEIILEPEGGDLLARYRLDGQVQTLMTMPLKIAARVFDRLNKLAGGGADAGEIFYAGRHKLKEENRQTAFDVAIITAAGPKKAVIRLNERRPRAMTLGQLGLIGQALAAVKKSLDQPRGLVLVSGPADSGKTTTLYSLLNQLNKPELNIATIEDPIEFVIPRLNQSQVNAKTGYTFAAGLRALLNQDPNVIAVGELRDRETASAAGQAALAGHLLLTTFNSADAVSALWRLYNELGVSAFTAAASVKVVLAQRLIKKICPDCISASRLDRQTADGLEKIFEAVNSLAALEKNEILAGLKTSLFYRGRGCPHCAGTGYRGQIGVYEALEISPAISELILRRAGEADLRRQARAENAPSLIMDGLIKAKNGVTTVEEVVRLASI